MHPRQILASRPLLFVALAYVLLAIAAGASGLFFDRAISGESTLDRDPFFIMDATAELPPSPSFNDPSAECIDYPCAVVFGRGVQAARWDTWTDLQGGGVPLGLEQCGNYFPLKWLYYVAPSRWTYDLFRVLRLAVAGIGTYLLARARGLPLGPAFVTGALFETSGALAAFLAFGNVSAPYMLPWMFLAEHRLIHTPGPRVAVGAAVVIGVTGLSGHPTQIVIASTAFALAWLADATTLWRDRNRLMKSTGWTFVAGLLGLAIAAPWTIPFAELVREGVTYKTTADGPRIRGMSLSQGRDALPLALFGPGSLLHGAHIGALDKAKPWILGQALGPVTLALAIGGLWIGRLKRALGVVLVLGVALTLAPQGLGWLYNAPMLGVVLPWYAWPLVAFPVAFAAGGAIHAMMQRRSPRRLLLGPVFVVLATIWVAWWLPSHRSTILQPADWALHAATTLRWAFAIHVLIVLATTGLAVYLWRKRPRVSAAVVSTLALVELAIVIWPYPRPHRTRALAKTPPIVGYLVSEQARTHGRVVARGMTGLPNIPTTYGIADFRSTTGVAIRRERSYFNLIATPSMTFHLVNRPGSPLLDAAAVTTWIEPTQRSKPPGQWLVPGYRLAFTGPAAAVYTNENALPRARIVHDATFVDGEANALQELKTLQQDREALLKRVVLEARPESVLLPGGAPTADERVDIISAEDPDQMVLEAQLSRDGLVVLADTYYPGWRAYVDGHEQSIWAANVMFRAIAVPAGKHDIIFRYEPRSLQLGSGLAGAGSALCLGILLWTRKRRYREVRSI